MKIILGIFLICFPPISTPSAVSFLCNENDVSQIPVTSKDWPSEVLARPYPIIPPQIPKDIAGEIDEFNRLMRILLSDKYSEEKRFKSGHRMAEIIETPDIPPNFKRESLAKIIGAFNPLNQGIPSGGSQNAILMILKAIVRDFRIDHTEKEKTLEQLRIIGKDGFLFNPQVLASIKSGGISFLTTLIKDSKVDREVVEDVVEAVFEFSKSNYSKPDYHFTLFLDFMDAAAGRADINPQIKEKLLDFLIEIYNKSEKQPYIRDPTYDPRVRSAYSIGWIIKDSQINPYKKIALFESFYQSLLDQNENRWVREFNSFVLREILKDKEIQELINRGELGGVNRIIKLAEELIRQFKNEKDVYSKTALGAVLSQLPLIPRDETEQSIIRNLITSSFNLAGINRGIWEQYSILLIEGTRSFTPEEANSIKHILNLFVEVFGKGELNKMVSLISTFRSFAGMGRASPNGAVWMEAQLREWFEPFLFHEIAHQIDFNYLSYEKSNLFDSLHYLSGSQPQNYAREYGMIDRLEDFATVAELWARNSRLFIDYARANKSNILLGKIKFVAELFTVDGKVYLFRTVDGHIQIETKMDYDEFKGLLQ